MPSFTSSQTTEEPLSPDSISLRTSLNSIMGDRSDETNYGNLRIRVSGARESADANSKYSPMTRTQSNQNNASTILVNFKGKTIPVLKDQGLSFHDFDRWVRGRFEVQATTKLAYFSEESSGTEIIPSGKIFMYPRIYIQSITEELKHSCLSAESKKKRDSMWLAFTRYGPAVLLALLSATLVPNSYCTEIYTSFREVLIFFGIQEYIVPLTDSFIGFLSWSITYLFVRRLLNPENSGDVLRRFFPDALFGGLAASVGVLLKFMLKKQFYGSMKL